VIFGVVVLVTRVTVEVLLPAVDQHVAFVVLFLGEGLVARFASKQTRLGVYFLVKFSVCVAVKRSVTKRALDLVHVMDSLVGF
jgi:hypothetical protein